jgi:hypothetical protein
VDILKLANIQNIRLHEIKFDYFVDGIFLDNKYSLNNFALSTIVVKGEDW